MPINLALPQAHELWLTSLSAQGRSDNTIKLYRYVTRQFIAWRSGTGPASDLAANAAKLTETSFDLLTTTRFEALAYTKYLTENFKPNGVKTHIKSLRSFFSWAMAEEFCDSNVFVRINITIPDDPYPTADEDQIDRLLGSAKSSRRDHALVTLLTDSGARRGEVAVLRIEDIDLRAGTVTFRESKSRPRTIPLSDRSVVSLGRWLRERGVGRGSLWGGNTYELVANVVERHSKGELTPHALRRRFAVQWMLRGGSETSLMRHCGWSSRSMIMLYSRASADLIAADEFKRLMG